MNPWLYARGLKPLPMVRQNTATECGLACVAMIAQHFGASTDLPTIRRTSGTSMKGATLKGIARACQDHQLSSRAVRCNFDELVKLRLPCILHWRFNHFVVLKAVAADGLVLHDPSRGVVREKISAAKRGFTGVALEVVPAKNFQQSQPPRRLSLGSLLSGDTEIRTKFAAGLLLALICEAILMTAPLYLQVVIDQVLIKGDRPLLSTIVVAFSAALLLLVLANILRQLTFAYLGHVSVFDVTSRVIRRLFTLPVRFFRTRELGDIQHRIQSLRSIQVFLVQALPGLVLDSIFVSLTAALLMLYDTQLTLFVLVILIVWCTWRLAILPRSLRLSNDIAQSESAAQTHLLESFRTMQMIKVSGGEAQREGDWRNQLAEVVNARIRASNLQIVDTTVHQLLFQGARIAVVYLLAERALGGDMSIGMLSAFVAYLGMFTARATSAVDRLLEYKMLDVPLNRLADIVFGEAENDSNHRRNPCVGYSRVFGDIVLENVSFTYARDEQDVLRRCSAKFPDASFTAIAGPSGVGKSSLLHVIAGNEIISDGKLLFAGQSSKFLDPQARRSNLAAVLQGDCLLKGSIAENIALFEPAVDRDAVHEAAILACIADEINALPMAYETRVGDLGSVFSRGQVQRILLARAFYRRPTLLLLDEATSGLDHELEKKVVASIREFPGTRIVVTHSDCMLSAADRVLWLHDGRLLSSRPDLNVWGRK